MNVQHSPVTRGPARTARVLLGGIGILTIVLGIVLFVDEIPSIRYPGVAVWLLGAIVVHDVIVAGAVITVGLLLRLAPWRTLTKAIVGGAAAVGGILAVVVVPAAAKATIGTANPTILPFDYVLNLVLVEAGIVVATVAIVGTIALARWSRRISPGSAAEH